MTTQMSQPSSCPATQTEAPVDFCVSGPQQLWLFSALSVSPSPPASPCLSLLLLPTAAHLCRSTSWIPCRLTHIWTRERSFCSGYSCSTALWGMTTHAWIPWPLNGKKQPQPFPALPQCTLPLCARDRTVAGHKDKVCGGNCCTWRGVLLLGGGLPRNDRWVHQLSGLGVLVWLRSG